MPKLLTKESILWAIAEQKLGYQFGTPERVDSESLAVVLPLLRHTVTPRSYTTFPEVETLDVKDSGRIDAMRAQNKGELAVFVRSGTIFKGATQERASMRSSIVLPGVTVDIKVRCIHQSRGISMGSKVNYGGTTPLDFEQSVYTSGFTASDQHDYWANATRSSVRMMAASGRGTSAGQPKASSGTTSVRPRQVYRSGTIGGSLSLDYAQSLAAFAGERGAESFIPNTDDLTSNYANFAKNFDAILRKVKLHDDQVGLALITEKGCQTVEVFDAHVSWKALHDDAIKRLGPSLAQKDAASVFEYKPEKAVEVVNAVLALPFTENLIYEHKPSNGDPSFKIVGLSAEKYTGEVVEFDGRVIHMMLLRME